MKDKKRIEILLKVIERIYSENPAIRESLDSFMVGVCAEEGVSREQVFFILLSFAVVFIIMDYSRKKKLNKRVEDRFFV